MAVPTPDGTWVVVIPAKPLGLAKSRLLTYADDSRRALSLAFVADTVAAACAAPAVRAVVVVTDDPDVTTQVVRLGASVLPGEPGGGLNAAVRYGEDHVRDRHPTSGVAALVGDLPALRAEELGRALVAAAGRPRSFVADAAGIGTTLLTALPGTALAPAFGVRSRAAHAWSGAVELALPGIPGLHRDVDDEVDLWDARRLGVGPATRAAQEAT